MNGVVMRKLRGYNRNGWFLGQQSGKDERKGFLTVTC